MPNISRSSAALWGLLVLLIAWKADLPAQVASAAYNLIEDDGTPLPRQRTLDMTGAGVTCSNVGSTTQCDIPGASATQQHSITFVIDGGGAAITAGALSVFPTAAFACTINRTDISADQSGDIEVDIWKAAGAIPTAGDIISASAPVTLSNAQLNQNGSISGWTTAVSSGDVFGAEVASAMDVERVTVQIWCD